MSDEDESSDEKQDDESSGENRPSPFRLFGQLFGVGSPGMSPQQAASIAEVRRRLGGEAGEKSYLDGLRTGLRERYSPSTLIPAFAEFRKAVGDELFNTLTAGGNLKWAMKRWEKDKLAAVVEWAISETLERVNNDPDETDLSRHQVEGWVRGTICFCGRCWND